MNSPLPREQSGEVFAQGEREGLDQSLRERSPDTADLFRVT
ncbi:MAG TPA: hypothetical protein VFB29_10965 [Pseudolabrys sp.]|nr:hypothetical protein [Pseudolabrys sp.]